MNLKYPFLLLVCLLVGLSVIPSAKKLRFPDEREYHQLALSLQSGEGFSLENGTPTAYRPPGYPFFLSLTYRLYDAPLTGKLANALLLAGSLWLMIELSTGASRFLAGFFLFAYPVLFYTAGTLYPQTLAGFLLLLILALLCRTNPRIFGVTAAGLLLGFLILCVPSFLLTAPVFAWILFRQARGNCTKRLEKVLILTAATLLIVTPWTLRNYRITGHFVPVSANSGLNLYLGNSPNAGPNTGVNVPRAEILETVKGWNEVETDRFYLEQSVNWIWDHPGQALGLYTAKCLNYFNFRNDLATQSQSGRLKDLLMLITWGPLLLIFVVRMFFFRKYPCSPIEKAIYLLVISNVFLSAIFFTRIRFRLPFDQLMILANALFVARFIQESKIFPKMNLR